MFQLSALVVGLLWQTCHAFQPTATVTTWRKLTRLQGATANDCNPVDRRVFVGSVGAFLLTTTLANPAVADDAAVDYKAVAADVADLVKANPDWGPTLVRLAWHSSGTVSMDRTPFGRQI